MLIREELEKREIEILSPLAAKSVNSKGRPPLAVSPSLLTPPPAHLHLPPGPRSPDLRVVAPPPRFTPRPLPRSDPISLLLGQRTGNPPGARF